MVERFRAGPSRPLGSRRVQARAAPQVRSAHRLCDELCHDPHERTMRRRNSEPRPLPGWSSVQNAAASERLLGPSTSAGGPRQEEADASGTCLRSGPRRRLRRGGRAPAHPRTSPWHRSPRLTPLRFGLTCFYGRSGHSGHTDARACGWAVVRLCADLETARGSSFDALAHATCWTLPRAALVGASGRCNGSSSSCVRTTRLRWIRHRCACIPVARFRHVGRHRLDPRGHVGPLAACVESLGYAGSVRCVPAPPVRRLSAACVEPVIGWSVYV